MNLDKKFSALQLSIINDQAALYTCACPIQVSLQIANLRKLFDYQKMCMEMDSPPPTDIEMEVHRRIALDTIKAHQLMEQCLDDILDLEGWDRTNFEVPTTGTRRRIHKN